VLRAVVEPGEINDKLTALTQLALDAASKEDTISAQKIEGEIDELLCRVIGIDPNEIF
jgi:hypothetical protein